MFGQEVFVLLFIFLFILEIYRTAVRRAFFLIVVIIALPPLVTIPVYILALDWGRYIYVSYSCSFFIAIFCYKSKILLSTYNLRFNRYIFILIIILYSFTLTFPFYNATNFKLVLEKPIKKILKIL